jgi:hypothetical protein
MNGVRCIYQGREVLALPVKKSGFALIDPHHADLLDDRWGSKEGYARRSRRERLLHRVIFERVIGRKLHQGEEVDHIDQFRMNNLDANLRLADRSAQGANRRKRPGKSEYRGIYPCKDGSFRSQINIKGQMKHLGTYQTEEEAAVMYDVAALHYRGEFAQLNFPDREPTPEELKRFEDRLRYRGRPGSESRYVGVHRVNRTNRKVWIATIGSGESVVKLGPFESDVVAAWARDLYLHETPRKRCWLNFPGQEPPEEMRRKIRGVLSWKGKIDTTSKYIGVKRTSRRTQYLWIAAVSYVEDGRRVEKEIGQFRSETTAAWARDLYVRQNGLSNQTNFDHDLVPDDVALELREWKIRKGRRGSASRYVGVQANRKSSTYPWTARVSQEGKDLYLVDYAREDEAAWARDLAVRALDLPHRCNFSTDEPPAEIWKAIREREQSILQKRESEGRAGSGCGLLIQMSGHSGSDGSL